ncbi:MAG: hypothetical protein CSA35_02090 [Dethiosulfovibrio peptidovorans]|nr:MAG: hypothetical protein CSA35_02090 [Dethiosulfovibrio peptidovorans]
MENIIDMIRKHIADIFRKKGLRPYTLPDGKILVIDDNFVTQFKLDISFNNNDFGCIVLERRGETLATTKSFNIAWSSGEEIHNFLNYLRSLR